MRVAIVNQYCDEMLPPYQNSVGACSYGIAGSLAATCAVRVYGLSSSAGGVGEQWDKGVHYRLLPTSRLDSWLNRHERKLRKLGRPVNAGLLEPRSTSRFTYPVYGRQVAQDISNDPVDIVYFQHCTQYIPDLRRHNPAVRIFLNVHHEFYPQCNQSALSSRLLHVDRVTCVSEFVANCVRRRFPEFADRVVAISNGVDWGEFDGAGDRRPSRQRETKQILYAGAVSPEKGLHVLLAALEAVNRSVPDFHLNIVGSPGSRPVDEVLPQGPGAVDPQIESFFSKDYLGALREMLSHELARKVSFLGMVPRAELLKHYSEADLFVFPSLWDEGFGLPPVESMAAGVPAVCARSGAVPENVLHEKTGLIVEKNDSSGLASALIRLLRDDALRQKMGAAGRERVKERYTWDRAAERLLAEMNAVL